MLSITSIPGLRIGHAHDPEALTGVTVILCEAGATIGVDQRGGAPGTRETDLARPMHLVTQAHAVVLTGGSAFGLDCVSGVTRYLEERGVGFDAGVGRVPIVPAACLFDLPLGFIPGQPPARPSPDMAYAACLAASADPSAEGNVGAGMGASVGKALGMAQAMKAGVGVAAIRLANGVIVAALAAVNAFGDVLDPAAGRIVAGARLPTGGFADTLALLGGLDARSLPFSNTVIGVVATSARLDKEGANKVAQMAHDGLARAIRPAHTMWDGDTIFALSLPAPEAAPADVSTIGAYAAEMFAHACLRAATQASPAGGLPSISSLRGS